MNDLISVEHVSSNIHMKFIFLLLNVVAGGWGAFFSQCFLVSGFLKKHGSQPQKSMWICDFSDILFFSGSNQTEKKCFRKQQQSHRKTIEEQFNWGSFGLPFKQDCLKELTKEPITWGELFLSSLTV